jgi:hypothetical protein
MTATCPFGTVPLNYLAARKVIGTAWTAETSKFQSVITECHKSKKICDTDDVPNGWIAFGVDVEH